MDRRGDAKSREMMLDELLGYDHVTIQCHDNPDADAIASGYGLYCFFRDKGKDTRLLYSGRNKVRKANLMLMVEKLHKHRLFHVHHCEYRLNVYVKCH